MTLRIEDPSDLPGSKVFDQEAEELGEIKDVYGVGDDGDPMWVAIETSGEERKLAVVPLARLRQEGDEFSVPYSSEHVADAPEVDADDEISEEDDQKLRIYYSIGLADDEFRTESNSYAGQVPEGEAPAKKITDDLDDKETPGGESKDRSVEERHEEYSPSAGGDSGSEDDEGSGDDQGSGDDERSGDDGDDEDSGDDEGS